MYNAHDEMTCVFASDKIDLNYLSVDFQYKFEGTIYTIATKILTIPFS